VAAGDERAGDRADVERYERLRAHALGGEASGWRLGLALLQGRGTAAWLRAGRGIGAVPVPSPPGPPCSEPAAGDELVSVLATMALAAAGG
jgi:hypothetical protein